MTSLGFIAFMTLMVLKLTDVIQISWLAASAPFWGAFIFDVVVFSCYMIFFVWATKKDW